MAKIMAVCGKICSGKSYYAKKLQRNENAVILSCDEMTSILFNNDLGEKHDEMSKRIWEYLLMKSVDIVKIGTSVILDWGFWSKQDRRYITNYFNAHQIVCEWHYIEVDDNSWEINIEERNKRILEGNGGSDYYLDEGLKNKLLSKWEEPTKDEIDIWFKLKR